MATVPQSRPRAVRLNTGGYAILIVFAVVLTAGIVGSSVLSGQIARERETAAMLASNGVDATAAVTDLSRASKDSQKRSVSFEFLAGGKLVRGQSKISLARWRGLQRGDAIAIRYAPDDPSVNALAGGSPTTPVWLPVLIVIAAALPGAFVVWAVSRQWSLLRDGRVTTAVVKSIRVRRDSHGAPHRSVTYEFQLLDGRTVTGKGWSPRAVPAVGSRVEVVYDPDRPKRNLTYPMQFVAVAGV